MAHWQERWNTLVGKLEVVPDATAAQRLLDRLSVPKAATVLGFVNAHAMNLVVRDGACHQALSAADVLLRDGSGLAILYRRLGLEPGLNMNGTDFIPRLLAAYRGRRVAFWGTRQPYLDQAVQRSTATFGVVPVSVHDGFASVDTYLQLARELQPELIVLGMGMPRQEVVAARLAAAGGPCLIVCGGAILDFLGGKVSRAPEWLRRLGGEWLYRLLREPKRLFIRYVVGNPLFLVRTLLFRCDGGRPGTPYERQNPPER
ncbi:MULTISPECIES: WecB/TagA/CpsF family glycosyltransferase [Pseudomonas]|jgi:exopolysaccharide biosynthesis WecB/TagA/CpsF family protein|uniref:Glycosyltransferase n=3 Tax=Pseudomonas TaxID=286 RepID=A0A099N1L5_PSEDL|nr:MULTISPECIES: WecB/TagA/CpsF family glycosyltransferase [Pseudomonas]AEJ13337.1 WecB/TagA/CpsF family glycosyl transferase [Pseudomonas putida S16]AHC82871.1 glycosyl transferase [Pseudomonas monteilii SB3078]AHC88247.1 glycosyl transferase [Pseudomonas monteilii SB3101]AHZ77553.1 WecB/TagA/CpsF glycosyl transferase [Pseudomonas putida]AJG13396.1 WecB/TagA/CpsF family glycosyl transferase [Pseudomonas plecoglossicida]